MIKSMTGFGRGVSEDEKREFRVEMRAVNHRYLDLNIRMPKSLMTLEDKMKKIITQSVSRREFSLEGSPTISLISGFPDVMYTKEKEENIDEIWSLLQQALRQALSSLLHMKQSEGEALKNDMLAKAESIKGYVDKIRVKDLLVIPQYKKRLEERIASLLETIPVDVQRLSFEIALYTDKASIDEEVTRLNSHMDQMAKFLREDEAVGRKLDFLAQEMNREANTMASKSVDLEITNIVLQIKNEIEKIREQVQNPIKRIIQEARERGMLIDATYGRRTRAVVVTDSDHIILSAVQPETVAHRLESKTELTEEGGLDE